MDKVQKPSSPEHLRTSIKEKNSVKNISLSPDVCYRNTSSVLLFSAVPTEFQGRGTI
jgi:hypothetical protein